MRFNLFRSLVKFRTPILSALVLFAASAGAQQPGAYVAVNASNVRSEASINGSIVTIIGKGDRVEVVGTERDGSWYKIQLADGRGGYVYGKLLRQVAGVTQAPAPAAAASSGGTGRPDAAAYFISPYDGEAIPGGRFWVRFGLRNMGVAPAGVERKNTGHHHLIVDADLPPLGEPIPSDDNYIHFGRGQTETFLELSPGEHTLQLLLGDHNHVPHDPPVLSDKITVIVE